MKKYMKTPFNHKTKKGFTLIELLFAMVFISILMLVIAYLIIYIISVYQKGLTMRAVSSTGRQIIDEITRSVMSSPTNALLSPSDDLNNDGVIDENELIMATRRYYFQAYATIDGQDVPVFGAFCTGSYTYMWNTAYAINAGVSSPYLMTYQLKSGEKTNTFRLIKVYDQTREICASVVDRNSSPPIYRFQNGITGANRTFTLTFERDKSLPANLIQADEADLALYDFQIFPATQDPLTGQIFYSSSFILATLRGGVNIMSTGNFCQNPSPGTLGTDFNFCAVNKFNFTMRATGAISNE